MKVYEGEGNWERKAYLKIENDKVIFDCSDEEYGPIEFPLELLTKALAPKDSIVKSVVEQFKQRSEVGIKKYGTTLADNNADDYLEHIKQELMDAVLYIEKKQTQLKEAEKKLKTIGYDFSKERSRI